MVKYNVLIVLVVLMAILSACNASAPAPQVAASPTVIPSTQPVDTPMTIPNTPASLPAAIDAPIVESPALVDMHFLNPTDGWGVTETQIVRTNDGGVTWYDITPPEVTETGFNIRNFALDVDHFWFQVPDFNNYPNSGFLYRTSDGGMNWTKSVTPFSSGDLKLLDEQNGWMLADLGVGAGSNAVAVFQTTDAGATWTKMYVNDPNQADAGDSLPLGGLKSGIAPLNMQTAFVYGVIYAPGVIYVYRTDNGGKHWTQIQLPSLPPGAANFEIGIDPDHLKFVSPTAGFMAVRISGDTMQTASYATSDSGKTWTLTPTSIPNGGSVDFLSATEAILYNGEQFYVTRDAAQTWTNVQPNVVFKDTFARMDYVNPSIGWVITQDANSHRSLYRTTDGGATWSPIIP